MIRLDATVNLDRMTPTIQNEQFNNQPIGVFDSGVGGLSIASCIHQTMPNESMIYLADSKFAPYGELSIGQITDRVNYIADFFLARQCKAIVVACNTATVNAIDQLRRRINMPVIGVEPAIKPAAMASKSGQIGILVTRATAKNTRFLTLVDKYKNGTQVHIQPCPRLVELIERGQLVSPELTHLLEQYLTPLLNHGIDHLVLGCTHYPFIANQIKSIVGNDIALMETAEPVTQQLKRQLLHYGLTAPASHSGEVTFVSSAPNQSQNYFLNQCWPNQGVSQLHFTRFE